ncbi:DUF4411 family protein [Roseivivax sp. GX 12232]|uniref:DUF4411 family protein n=1 Tax=Roseivivax sp. GX 12232 TaxID=2900547 RepID=UPI001E32147E|nr:DUF4411 family protein [Roseivivax sp. GX 12232]MCE0507281.1 DUF4411 family protein [Roseivivax sp. GX 12232]
MLYLIDANTLIRADADYYPIDRVPQFWDWLQERAEGGDIKMPFEIFSEVCRGKGALPDWLSDKNVEEALVLDEEVDATHFQKVVEQGYASDLTDEEIEQIGADPFLAAYALTAPSNRTVVTKETSRPRAKRQNRKLPDVCSDFGVRWITDFVLYKELDFRIGAT